jgi:ketosteroid isomerase-like protein
MQRRSLMRHALALVALATAVPPVIARAQDVAREITRLEDAWAVAQARHDGAALAKMLVDDCTQASPEGTLKNKMQMIADIDDRTNTYVSVTNSENKVTVKGTTAIVTGIWTEVVKAAKANDVRKYRYTDTWIKQPDGRWQYVSGQSTRLPK